MNDWDIKKVTEFFRLEKDEKIVDIWYAAGSFGIDIERPKTWPKGATGTETVDLSFNMTKEEAIRDFGKKR